MFIQMIEGRTSDSAGLKRQMDDWMSDLRPGAEGFLGTTAGVAPGGHFIALARFESEADARANSNRHEQGQWWAETERYFDGEVSFTDTSDIDLMMDGGSDDAGFVQVMKVNDVDRDTVARLDDVFRQVAPTYRPDVRGMVRAWTDPRSYVEAVYFTSEGDARAAESVDPPPELASSMAEFQQIMERTEFIDLSDPWLY